MANFALGLRSGQETASGLLRSMTERERALREQEEYDQKQAYLADAKRAATPAEVSTQKGLQVTGPDGKTFYIPAGATEGADAYRNAAGYTVDPEQRQYQDVTGGGRNLGQFAGTEDPQAGGLAQQYNADKYSRMANTAEQHGRLDQAAAANTLGLAGLTRRHIEQGIEAADRTATLFPGQKTMQELQVGEAQRKHDSYTLATQMGMALGSGNLQELGNIYTKSHPHPEGHTFTVEKDPKDKSGEKLIVRQIDTDGKVVNRKDFASDVDLGAKMHASIDPEKAFTYYENIRKGKKDDQQHAEVIKKLEIYARAVTSRTEMHDPKAYQSAVESFNNLVGSKEYKDAFESGDRVRIQAMQQQAANIQTRLANAAGKPMLGKIFSDEKPKKTMTPLQVQQTIKAGIENTPNFWSLPPADQAQLRAEWLGDESPTSLVPGPKANPTEEFGPPSSLQNRTKYDAAAANKQMGEDFTANNAAGEVNRKLREERGARLRSAFEIDTKFMTPHQLWAQYGPDLGLLSITQATRLKNTRDQYNVK